MMHPVLSTIAVSGLLLIGLSDPAKQFQKIKITAGYNSILLENPLLMELTGAKAIKMKNGNTILISVSSVVLENESPKAELDGIKIARSKALANLAAEIHGVQVFRLEKLDEKTQLTIENGKEKGKSISSFLQITEAKVEGIVKNMQPIGSWYSADGKVFYLAIGECFDTKGEKVDLR